MHILSLIKFRALLVVTIALFISPVFSQTIPDGYYDGTEMLSGDDLKITLHQIIRNHKKFDYSDFRDVILPTLDEDPNNPDNIIVFYKNSSVPKEDFASGNDGWNREHTWPSSHGFPSQSDTTYTDAHNLRPSDATVNSSKSNKDFGDLENTAENEQGEAPNTYTNSDFWEPRDEIKGDVARILFYMDVRYESERLDLKLVDRESISSQPELGVLYTLIQWHEADPVDEAEIERHEGVYGYQGNRNPFIDHPEWVAEVFGSTSEPLLVVDDQNFNPDFGTVEIGNSLVQTYDVNAYNLTDDLSVEVEAPFSVSTDQTNWTDSIGFMNDAAGEQSYEVFVRYEPSVADEVANATIIHYTNGDTVRLDVTGQEGGVELLTITEAREKSLGDVVFVTGIVINPGNNSSNNKVIYDGTAGIVVRSFDNGNESADLMQGDSITISGGLGDFNNLLQIVESPIVINVVKQGADLFPAQVLEISEIGEDQESELVTLQNVSFVSTGEFSGGGSAGNSTITDGTDKMIFRIGSSGHPLVDTEIPSDQLNITGFIGQFGSDYQISPRTVDDMEVLEGVLGAKPYIKKPGLIYPNPVQDSFYLSLPSDVKMKIAIISLQGKVVEEFRSSDGSNLNVSNLEKGIYLIVVEKEEETYYSRLIKE